MQKCNSFNENVLSTAKMVMVMFAISFITVFASCEKERMAKPAEAVKSLKDSSDVIKDHYSASLRTLTVTATPVDALTKSDVDFQHTAVMQYGDEMGERYNLSLNPTAYAYVRQSKERIEIGSELELPTTLVKRETIARTPYFTGTYKGEDVHVRFTYSDGDVDDVYYGWKSLTIIDGVDTLATPHIEFADVQLDSIMIKADGEQTALDKPHRVTTQYGLSFTTKGVSNKQTTSATKMRPYRIKSITDVEQTLTGEVKYEERWVGCPITAYELTQIAPTNKGEVVTKVSFPVVMDIKVPELREQPSLDSLFNAVSTGSFKSEVLSDSVKNADGFVALSYSGTYTSKNVGKENSTSIESTATFIYTVPVQFSNRWGSYNITAPKLSFEEGGFALTSVSEDEDNHIWNTTNTIIPTFGTCTLDALDEIVRITVAKAKAAIPVDSTYTKSGRGDEYIVDKTVFWSDGSKTTSQFQYDGRHSATATNFGEKITSNLSWNASALKANGTNKENEKKEFTPTTRFEVVYTTTNMKSDATNGVESGVFGFSETHPVVVFVDGDTKVSFDERKVILSGSGAQLANNFNIVVKDGVSYKGYTYNMACGVVFDGEAESDVVSLGTLLIVADEVGAAQYTHEQTWNGNVTTVKVIKTTPHSFGEDEVETYTQEFAVAMTELSNGKVYAENFNFSAEVTNDEKSDERKDGFWTIKSYNRNFKYVVSNTVVKREMNNVVTDGEIVFNDGTYTFTFPAKFNVTASESFGDVRSEGDYKVTPHIETVTASIVGGPQLMMTGTTNIYVEQDKVGDTSYKTEESWSGNVFTAKVTKTTKHSKAQDEVETFTKSFTVSMTDLSDGRVDAENTNFSAQVTNKEKNDEAKDGQWTVKSTVRNFTYVVANDAVKREMSNSVTDGELVFTDGSYTHTFKARLSVSNTESLGNTTTEGNYQITPHTVNVTATAVGGPTLTTKGVTNIYVEQDRSGQPTYKAEESWSGNTFTAKVTKTTPHTKADAEVEIFTKMVTVSMSDLSDGKVTAANTSFTITVTNTENVSDEKDNQWTVKNRTREYKYVDSNGTVKREMSNTVKDAEIVFVEGSYTHTFKPQLAVSNTDAFGTTTTDGDYQVTPHTTTVKAVASGTGAPTLTTKGTTSIYVEVKKEITYQVSSTLDEVVEGEAYYNVKVSRLLNGQVEKSWTAYISGVAFGTYRPSVDRQIVSELQVARYDDEIADLPEQSRTYTAGKTKNFSVDVTAKEYHFRTFFNAPKDAEGKTEREISSHLNVWSSEVTFTDPDNGHTEKISYAGKAESIKSEVENSTYIRVIRITCNGEKLEDQTGSVQLILAQ